MTSLPLSDEPTAPGSDGTPPDSDWIQVNIDRGSLIGLLLLNTFLTVITLGIYRFWARTKVRQRLWSAITLRGDRFAYTGTGKELFVGFLVALVVLLPFLGVITLLNSLIPPTEFVAHVVMQFIIGLGAGLLGLMALYFARRYLLTRTQWRGIHGGQDKALGKYMAVHLKAYLKSALTLGLIQPMADAETFNFRQSITWFGTARFGAAARADGLWSIWIPTWLTLLVGYGFLFSIVMPMSEWTAAAQAAQAAGVAPPPQPEFNLPGFFGSFAAIFVGFGLWFAYVVRRTTLFIGETWLDGMRFDLPISWRQVVHVPIMAFVFYIVALFVIAGLMAVSGAVFGKSIGMVITVFFALFLILALLNLLSVAWVQVELLRVIGLHLRLHHVSVLDDILNRGQPAPTRGEGLADAIGDIGIGA
ncbi:MAG: DUF898 family protein [Niveispirillum sp.]|nr:DUF898 family protein [Niveispirillum sp.]